jgi:hypothetical protein
VQGRAASVISTNQTRKFGSPSRIRTYGQVINSHLLYR